MKKTIKSWQGWLLFIGTMAVVFILGLLAASINERHAETANIYNNRKTPMKGIQSRNDLFSDDFSREYQTWLKTAETDFSSEFNGSSVVDVLEKRPEMVVLWAGYAFSREYGTPRGHMHAIEDMQRTLRVGAPGVDGQKDIQPATCWTCKSPDVPRLMETMGIEAYYSGKWSSLGSEVVNPIGCSDCHDSETMNLQISRPALIEAFERVRGEILVKQRYRKCVAWYVHNVMLSTISKGIKNI